MTFTKTMNILRHSECSHLNCIGTILTIVFKTLSIKLKIHEIVFKQNWNSL